MTRLVCLMGMLPILLLGACGDDEEENGDNNNHNNNDAFCESYTRTGFVVEGTVHNAASVTIPSTVKVYVDWVVTSGSPDHDYTLGEGCYDAQAGKYVMALANDPPTAALNDYGACKLGVANVHLFDGDVVDGSDMSSLVQSQPEDWYGATDRFAIIFVQGDCSTNWPADFPAGYGLGSCVTQTTGFDDFDSVTPSSTDAVLNATDDVGNLDWCNWT